MSDLDFQQLLAFHKAHGKVATVTAVRPPGRFGEIRADGGGVEKFNDHWQQKFKDRVVMNSEAELRRQSPIFEHRHNTLYRYSPLGGKTPAAALAASGVSLRFAATERAPRHPPPKPEAGRYHLIRFIRSEGILDIFGEKFAAPPEATIHTQVLRRPPVIERERINFE